jgi:single-strand DNA-binding protein
MNKAILMGRLTKDPEIKYTKDNLEICNFSIAVNRKFAKKDDEVTADFINIVAFGKTASFCFQYFQKGKQVSIVGRIQVSSWENVDGKRQYKTEIVAEEVFFADSKSQDSPSPNPKPKNNPSDLADDEFPF